MAPKRRQTRAHDAPVAPGAESTQRVTLMDLYHYLSRADVPNVRKVAAIKNYTEDSEAQSQLFEMLIDWLSKHPPMADIDEPLTISKQPPGEHDNILDEADETAESALHESKKRGIHTERMEFDAQDIIEQALLAGAKAPDNPAHPEPDTRAQLEATTTEATRLHEILTELRERSVPLTATEAEFAIAGLHEIAERNTRTAWQLGLHAVERGLISQVKLAELLGSSSATVSRRYRGSSGESTEQR
jgi:hypothetical protein